MPIRISAAIFHAWMAQTKYSYNARKKPSYTVTFFNRSAPFATLDSVLAFSELASAIKSDGREWSEKSCQKMVERELKRTPPSEYSVGEKVIIRASWPQTTRETAD